MRFTTAATLVSELIEARDDKKLLRLQKQLASYELLIVDELGFVPLSKTGAELLFELLSQRYERASTLVTSNLPFAEWTEILGSERLTGALLDQLTHHVHILEMVQKRRGWVRLHEKGGKVTELPCHHNLDQYLEEWIAASGLGTEPKALLFPTLRHGRLTGRTPLPQANVHLMIQGRAKAAGLRTKISAHSFRATGITTYLQDGGKLEIAQQMAGHESARTTGLYDRRNDQIALDEIERIAY